MKDKICDTCGERFTATGNNQKRCAGCKRSHEKSMCKARHQRTYVRTGYKQAGVCNNNWKGGIGTYREGRILNDCNRCENRAVLTHHIDRNRNNNVNSNLEDLCKKCHQEEHKCSDSLPKGAELSELKKIQAKSARRGLDGRFVAKV